MYPSYKSFFLSVEQAWYTGQIVVPGHIFEIVAGARYTFVKKIVFQPGAISCGNKNLHFLFEFPKSEVRFQHGSKNYKPN